MDDRNDDQNRKKQQDNDQIIESLIYELLQRVRTRSSPSDETVDGIKANVKLAWQQEVDAQGKKRSARKRYSIAAGLFLAIGVGTATLMNSGVQDESYATIDKVVNHVEYQLEEDGVWRDFNGANIKAEMNVRTDANSYASIVMTNGLNVRLDHNSQIRLMGVDEIKLDSGTIYVDSGNDERIENSIRVTTPFGRARDIGTQFSVSVMPNSWRVQVREGSVEINRGDAIAFAGEQVLIRQDNTTQKSAVGADDESWQWTQEVAATFALEGATLSAFLRWVSRETGKPLEYQSQLAKTRATATILHGSIKRLKPLESLSVVLSTTNFQLATNDPDKLLVEIIVDRQ
jgi:hypothetical protein